MSKTYRAVPHWFNPETFFRRDQVDNHVIGRMIKGADGSFRNEVFIERSGMGFVWRPESKRFFKRRTHKQDRQLGVFSIMEEIKMMDLDVQEDLKELRELQELDMAYEDDYDPFWDREEDYNRDDSYEYDHDPVWERYW